jgi:hypothetical protein
VEGLATDQANAAASARGVVAYLLALRPIMAGVIEQRRTWIRDVGLLIEESRTGDPITLSRKAGQLAHGQLGAFREARTQHTHLLPPPQCYPLHEAVAGWLDKHVEACETLVRAERDRSLKPLRDVQEQLGDARRYSQTFNEQYGLLVTELRQRVDAALAKRGRRGGRRSRQRGGGGIWSLFRR